MRTLCFTLVLFTSVASAQENPARAVVKAAIEAHGGTEALIKARTARTTASGTIIDRGREIKFTAAGTYAMPDRYRVETSGDVDGSKLVMIQILNGKKTKVSSKLNGVEAAVNPKLMEETVQAGLLQEVSTLTPLLEAKKYAIKLGKDVDINGNPATVVLVTGNGLKEVKLSFDKKSNRLVKTQRRAFANGAAGTVEVDEETVLSDFKLFGKTLLPTAMVVNHDGKKFMTVSVTDWKFLDKVDDKEFLVD